MRNYKLTLALVSAVLFCLFAFGSSAWGVTVTWDGGGGGDEHWTNALNWDTESVPRAGDDVVIGPGVSVVQDDTLVNYSVNSIQLQSGATLDWHDSNITIESVTILTGATFNMFGGTLTINGNTRNSSIDGGTLNNSATVVWGPDVSHFNIVNSGQFINSGFLTLSAANGSPTSFGSAGGTFTNSGTVN